MSRKRDQLMKKEERSSFDYQSCGDIEIVME